MTTGKNKDQPNSEISDFELARRVSELSADPSLLHQPSRDLWVGIERQIADYPQRERPERPSWMPYAVAASLLIAVSALTLNVLQISIAPGNSEFVDIDQINNDYLQVRNPLVEEFSRVNKSLDDRTMTELHRNLEIIEQARRELEQQVRDDPDNERMLKMLMRVHEQELELLKRDFSAAGKSL